MSETAGSVRLCVWRKRKGLSQKRAGELFCVSQPAYGLWERGVNRPDGDARVLLSRGTGGLVDPIDFMRPPAPEDYDLAADVAVLRASAARPSPEAA